MRVKISYSMELDEVPTVVANLIDKCTENLAAAQGLTLATSEEANKNPNALNVWKIFLKLENY